MKSVSRTVAAVVERVDLIPYFVMITDSLSREFLAKYDNDKRVPPPKIFDVVHAIYIIVMETMSRGESESNTRARLSMTDSSMDALNDKIQAKKNKNVNSEIKFDVITLLFKKLRKSLKYCQDHKLKV
jgi:predicted RNA-binding protein with EMAP domain